MLYIKFDIIDSSKYFDFHKLFNHMINTRQPNYEEEEEEEPKFNWENMTDKEMEVAFQKINDFDPKVNRYKKIIPNYADTFFKKYLNLDKESFGEFSFKGVLSILNYLEYSFEVNMDNLEKLNENKGIIKFSTGNYPFGGIDRFLLTLKAFDLVPNEYYNGFSILKLIWVTDFKYDTIELPEKTKGYLNKMK